MRDALAHRGPDGAGEMSLHSGSEARPLEAWLGHRRLKVIDLSDAATQPLTNEDASVAVTFNGEIYNFRALRDELVGYGHRFRSRSDTEVLVHGYEQWGDEVVTHLDGMFAFAIFDARAGRLLLARDRTGKKPLYYSVAGGRLTFASELSALRQAPWVAAEPDHSRLGEYLTFGYVPPPHTMYRDILEVPPASTVGFDAAGVREPVSYWDWPVELEGRTPLIKGEPERSVQRLLEEAVERRMIADVPLGALLSGGVDSSIIVGLMSRLSTDPVRTFSIGFPEDASFDERGYARMVSDHFGTRHTEFAVRADAVSLMDTLLWHHGQPFHDSSAIPTYLVCQLAREHVTVVLNGDGGDEVFAGYDRFRGAALSGMLPTFAAGVARRAARALPVNHGYFSVRRRAERFLELADMPVRDRYQSWISVFNGSGLGELINDEGPAGDPLRAMNDCYQRARRLPDLDQILYANFKTYLPGDLAVKMDRMSMAHGLETRSPFLDTAVVERMARIPAMRKIGLRRVKPVLRQAFWPLLPKEIWNRRKHGFGVPMGHWMRGQLGDIFRDEVLSTDARTSSLLCRETVGKIFDEHRAGVRERCFQLWTLLMLERWLRDQERPPATAPPVPTVSA